MKNNNIKNNNFSKNIGFFQNNGIINNELDEVKYKKNDFFEKLNSYQNQERQRLFSLKRKYDQGLITEEEISEDDIDSIIELYEEETRRINENTKIRKIRIRKMLDELKSI